LNNKNILKKIYQNTIEVYQENFHYLSEENLTYYPATQAVKGQFSFLESNYLRSARTACFNNTETLILSNQLMYVGVYSLLVEEPSLLKSVSKFHIPDSTVNVEKFIKKTISYIVVTKNNFTFSKVLLPLKDNEFKNANTCSFSINDVIASHKGLKFVSQGSIGKNHEFTFEMISLLINDDIHGGL